MSNFIFTETEIRGAYIIDVKHYQDARGFFMETYQEQEFQSAGIDYRFVQDCQSFSHRGVLRGLHFQKKYPQAKLVRVLRGEVFDVAVDLRADSPTYAQWVGLLLSAENRRQFLIPKGFAHGFLVLSEEAEFAYKCDAFYHPEDEGGIRWDDPTLAIRWPAAGQMILSEKDQALPLLEKGKILL